MKYRTDYYNRPSNVISFMSVVPGTSDHLHCEFVLLLFLEDHRETDWFLPASGVQIPTSNRVFPLPSRGVLLTAQKSSKDTSSSRIQTKTTVLCIDLNIDDTTITSKSHTHTSHSETFLLFTSSLSIGVSVPHTTQCM